MAGMEYTLRHAECRDPGIHDPFFFNPPNMDPTEIPTFCMSVHALGKKLLYTIYACLSFLINKVV